MRLISASVILVISSVAMSATLTVDDSGPADFATIQAAIDAASPGDLIQVYPGTYHATGNQVVDAKGKAVIIKAISGSGYTSIDGQGQRRGVLFGAGETAATILDGFTIINCTATEGGGIACSNSSPTIIDCVITNNHATSTVGGGIACLDGSPSLSGCTISLNSAVTLGGGLYCLDGHPNISNCDIANNTAGSQGGGLYATTSDPILVDCTVRSNQAPVGAGIYATADSLPVLTGVLVCENDTDQIQGPWTNGGGTEVADTCPLRVPEDYATIQSAIDAAIPGDVIVVAPGTYTSIDYQVVHMMGKSVTLRASGSVEETIIDGEGARRGITCDSGETNDTIIEGFTITNGKSSQGGGVYCFQSSPTLRNCDVVGNTTQGWAWPQAGGGGIYCELASPLIDSCTISNNAAIDDGSGWGVHVGGGINYSSSYYIAPLQILNCTITNNTAAGDGGGIYCRADAPEVGNDNSLIIRNCTITQNSAYEGAGIFCENYSNWEEGTYDPFVVIDGCTISDNEAAQFGGGFSIRASKPTITDCVIERNSASGNIETQAAGGGGLLGERCLATMTNCSIRDNSAPGGGGGIAFHQADVTMIACLIDGNFSVGAGGLGGAQSTLAITSCTISNNLANGGGGGGFYQCVTTLSNCDILANSGDYGGGLAFYEGTPSLVACTIRGNTGDFGGGVYGSWCQIGFTDCYVAANSASLQGGGIMCDLACIASMSGTTVCGNTATQLEGDWVDLLGNTVSDICPATCLGDFNADNMVAAPDLQLLLDAWGTENSDLDIDGNGVVGIHDLLELLERWGTCP
jgi:predicted outer membrane repeat protein